LDLVQGLLELLSAQVLLSVIFVVLFDLLQSGEKRQADFLCLDCVQCLFALALDVELACC
jgi:hypothetical protein